jgi:hypothetical protein
MAQANSGRPKRRETPVSEDLVREPIREGGAGDYPGSLPGCYLCRLPFLTNEAMITHKLDDKVVKSHMPMSVCVSRLRSQLDNLQAAIYDAQKARERYFGNSRSLSKEKSGLWQDWIDKDQAVLRLATGQPGEDAQPAVLHDIEILTNRTLALVEDEAVRDNLLKILARARG